jgi:hypothetical protein
MIAIDNVLLTDDIIEKQFVCDLHKCKGGCCIDGDAGAPLEISEMAEVEKNYEKVKPLLSNEAIEIIERRGKWVSDPEHGLCTPTIGNGICVYGFLDANGVVKCSFEKIYNEGKSTWKKPISCHLYPIIAKPGKIYEKANYEPREKLCAPACVNGEKLKVPVYEFLKEPIIRKWGADFYNALDHIAKSRKK